jgi:predicted PolB exonuclease-like 3'-5' exonuclease
MASHVVVWDIETICDLAAVKRLHALDDSDDAGAREVVGDKFPKLPFHSIVCIGALVAERTDSGWEVRSIGAPHVGERSEAELIQAFVKKIGELCPQLVGFNTHGFDLPVLRYRAMMNAVCAPGLAVRPYFHRYADASVDLCDMLAGFQARSKMSLHELGTLLGYAGKAPGDLDGAQVERYVQEGRIAEVSGYCEGDVVATYLIWLRYEFFRGSLTQKQFAASEANLFDYITTRLALKPHLAFLLGSKASIFNAVVPRSPLEVIGAEPRVEPVD